MTSPTAEAFQLISGRPYIGILNCCTLERGLDEAALNRMMDENFARPSECRRWFDRSLMNGEWPALLQVMGKTHLNEPYLSLVEVKDLFVNRRLPERVTKRLLPHQ